MSTPTSSTNSSLTHIGADGHPAMVDVSAKEPSHRMARAEGFVRINADLERRIRDNSIEKGSVLDVARLAGILAAKKTSDLIPLCHSLPLDGVDLSAEIQPGRIRIEATARTHARTGVEMEALTAVAVACLTVVDMGKSVDRWMTIEGIRMLEKRGGRSGTLIAP